MNRTEALSSTMKRGIGPCFTFSAKGIGLLIQTSNRHLKSIELRRRDSRMTPNLAFENDARISAFLKFTDLRSRISTLRCTSPASREGA